MSLSIDFRDISLMDLWTKVIWMLDLNVLEIVKQSSW